MNIFKNLHIRQSMMRFRYWIVTALFASVMLAGSGTAFAARCTGGDFFGFPKWYKYLNCTTTKTSGGAVPTNLQTPQLQSINDIWLIAAAVLEMMLRLAALAAVGFVIFGGIQYIVSRGEPDKTKQAQGTIMNAVIGLVLAIISAATVSYIAGRFH